MHLDQNEISIRQPKVIVNVFTLGMEPLIYKVFGFFYGQRGNEKESKPVTELRLRDFTDFEGVIKVGKTNRSEKEIKRII